MLAADNLSVDEGYVSFVNPVFGQVRLPIAAAGIFYKAPGETSPRELRRKCDEMKLTATTDDVLVVVKDRNFLTVTGLLKAVNEKTITFRWKDEDRKIDRDMLRVILFGTAQLERPRRAGTIICCDGSTVGFESVKLEGDLAVIRAVGIGERKIPRDKLAAIRFESDRVVRLSALKPAKVTEYGVFKTFPHRVDSSVGGGPISLGGRTYDSGLGLHSFCELTYELGGKFGTFVAVVGIDDSVRPGGDAVLTFLGDGKELAAPIRLTGRDEPKTVRLSVSQVRVMTVRVDFGQHGLDSQDHVDLAAARLIK